MPSSESVAPEEQSEPVDLPRVKSAASSAPTQSANARVDIAIVGGGLSGALMAWRLKTLQPDIRLKVIEKAERLGGNHTWSFHATDLTPDQYQWIEPLIVHSWDSQEVRFPGHRRHMPTGYRSITSERLHEVVAPVLGDALVTGASVTDVGKNRICLDDQSIIEAGAVIDARGKRDSSSLTLGFQKFLGLEIEFEEPHGLDHPIIMDATVPQTDGYRFVYVLPFTDRTALVEDTYYADGAALDSEVVRQEIRDYCEAAGWKIKSILREEEGVLPIAMAGDIEAHLAGGIDGVGQAGLGAALFHPLTGYSLPDAATLADRIANTPDINGEALAALTRAHSMDTWNDRGFYRMLSRFLFDAAEPGNRYLVMRRFYKLHRPLIERFYAGVSTKADKLRVLAGKPPVGFFKALECVDEDKWLRKWQSKAQKA